MYGIVVVGNRARFYQLPHRGKKLEEFSSSESPLPRDKSEITSFALDDEKDSLSIQRILKEMAAVLEREGRRVLKKLNNMTDIFEKDSEK